jgi:hypothetical protein
MLWAKGNDLFVRFDLLLTFSPCAKSSAGKFVYDPFAGTGSLLYTCAHWGSMVVGSDIDGRQMRGKGEQRNNYTKIHSRTQIAQLYNPDLHLLDLLCRRIRAGRLPCCDEIRLTESDTGLLDVRRDEERVEAGRAIRRDHHRSAM